MHDGLQPHHPRYRVQDGAVFSVRLCHAVYAVLADQAQVAFHSRKKLAGQVLRQLSTRMFV